MEIKNTSRNHLKILCVSILTFLLLLVSSQSYAHGASKYHVLVIHSYNKGLTWTDNIQKGIESVFEPIADQVELKVEYMDSKIVKFDEKFKTKLFDLYKHKYSTSQFNVIISSDDNALTFLREYHKDLFPDTPLIFCGVNNINIPNIIDRNLFSGILEIAAERETLDLALQLHPQTKKVIIVCGNTPSGKARWKQIERMFKYYPQLQFSRIDSSYSMAEIEEKVEMLPDDTIGIFATLYRDKSDQFFSLKEGVKRVSSASRRPLYTYHAQVLQHGTVGGKLLGGFQHGYLAAELAHRIFQGERTADIRIIDKSIAQYMFNYIELKRFGIDLSELPEGSIITQKPFSFYEEYKKLVWGAFFITLILTFIIGILVLNIIKRKKAESEIIIQKSFIQNALDAQNDTFFVFDPFTGKAIQWNKAFESISGYSNDEISSLKAPESYYSKEDLEKASKYIERVLSGETGTVELELICKDGHRVSSEYSASFIRDGEGKPKTLISVGRDITARKKAEEEKANLESQLRQHQKIQAIGTLAGGIAHDFNNILTAVLGYAEMAKDGIPDWNPARNQIEEVVKAGNRAKDLVKQILTFSRKAEQSRIPVQIHLLAKEIQSFLRATIPTNIEIELNVDPHCGRVFADPTHIHQVLLNLCTNAAHAMEEKGGTLTLVLKAIELKTEKRINNSILKTGSYVLLSVSDTGVGIEQEHLDKIFDPYFTTKEVGKGSGMGLAVVHGIVHSLGGHIIVESNPGRGTTFKMYFLKDDSEEDIQGQTVDATPLPCGKEKILIVDDEESIANLTQKRLEELGYQATAKTDSTEVLELFSADSNAYDLVITDQTMPKMTGEQLAKELMKIRPDLPIIMRTGYSSRIDAAKASSIGIRAFIMKPVDNKELARTVRQVLDGS